MEVEYLLGSARSQAKVMLPASLNDAEARVILRRYTAAIEGNFVAWMGAAAISARSVQGRYAASENLWVEMKDDHAGMLRNFAKSANAEPEADDYRFVAKAVANVRAMVGEMSGVKNLTLMAILENASPEFIPLLEEMAVQLGSTNTLYTKIHGEADVVHAEQFSWALKQEVLHYPDGISDAQVAAAITVDFLGSIFKTSLSSN